MRDQCEVLRERMPDVAHGAGTWTEAEEAHLAGCAECAAEWRLVRTALHLGDAAARRVDPARLAAAVAMGVVRERRVTRWKRVGWLSGLAAAATVALVVWRGSTPNDAPAMGDTVAEYLLPLAELESLDETQLQAVLDALDAPLSDGGSAGGPTLGDLTDTQLERVLRSLEG
jgi:hypothetical protein